MTEKYFKEVPLRNKIDLIVDEYEKHRGYLQHNTELFEIYEGNLLPKVDQILKDTLSKKYYNSIKHRIYPLNILTRVIDKLARAYDHNPIRSSNSNSEILELYEDVFDFDDQANTADEFSHLFKGYAYEPFVDEGEPGLRVLPFDRFFAISEDLVNPTKTTIFVKILGKVTIDRKESVVLFCYSDNEFLAITHEGKVLPEYMVENEGVNKFGVIPIYYANRSKYDIMPTQDTDILPMSKLLPVLYTDLGGAVMFQCFAIIYGIDVNEENVEMNPNAFWSLKSDKKSDKRPEVGTIKGNADVNKVLDYIGSVFSSWMESKGIRVGSLGSVDGQALANGISKIIDEMDTSQQIAKSIKKHKKDEKAFWRMMITIHNQWVADKEITGSGILPATWEVTTDFDEPTPNISRSQELDNIKKEEDSGYISHRTAIEKANPDWSEERIEEELKEIELEKKGRIGDV